jgi:hypothetical protein
MPKRYTTFEGETSALLDAIGVARSRNFEQVKDLRVILKLWWELSTLIIPLSKTLAF